MDTDLEQSQIEVTQLIMRNRYGYDIRVHRMGPFLISNLTAFKHRLELARGCRPADVRYITQDRNGYMSTARQLPKSVVDKWMVTRTTPCHSMQSAFADYRESQYAGIVNPSWRNAVVPRPFIYLALAAIERWYSKMDTSGGTQLSHTPYSIAMRIYAHKRKMKSISKGESNGSK